MQPTKQECNQKKNNVTKQRQPTTQMQSNKQQFKHAKKQTSKQTSTCKRTNTNQYNQTNENVIKQTQPTKQKQPTEQTLTFRALIFQVCNSKSEHLGAVVAVHTLGVGRYYLVKPNQNTSLFVLHVCDWLNFFN